MGGAGEVNTRGGITWGSANNFGRVRIFACNRAQRVVAYGTYDRTGTSSTFTAPFGDDVSSVFHLGVVVRLDARLDEGAED